MSDEMYCTFKQAVLLKNKGFPQYWNRNVSYYYTHDQASYIGDEIDEVLRVQEQAGYIDTNNKNVLDFFVVRPTLAEVQKWFRERSEISIDVFAMPGILHNKWAVQYCASFVDIQPHGCWNEVEDRCYKMHSIKENSYEKALSLGINKVLNLL